jgi:hypothetical protein
VILCDYYYFLFCVMAGAIMLCWRLLRFDPKPAKLARALGVFTAVAATTSGPFVLRLAMLSRGDPLFGSHDPRDFSLDLLAPFIPGGHWRFHRWTSFFWTQLPGFIHESSVHWGISALVLAIVAWVNRERTQLRSASLWALLGLFFTLLALGPALQFAGQRLPGIPGPYALLEILVPPFRVSGVPVRMSVMIMLCLGILCGQGFEFLTRRPGPLGSKLWALALCACVLFEYLPRPLTEFPAGYPSYVNVMKTFSKAYGYVDVDDVMGNPGNLYYQTAHETPMFGGYIARIPASVVRQDEGLQRLIDARRWRELCEEHGFRYLIFRSTDGADARGADLAPHEPARADAGLDFYDLGMFWSCKQWSTALRDTPQPAGHAVGGSSENPSWPSLRPGDASRVRSAAQRGNGATRRTTRCSVIRMPSVRSEWRTSRG